MNLNLGYTKLIMEEASRRGLLRNELAYVLATAYWETAKTMKPVKEAFWLSEDWRKKNLRYYPWYGRGFVQLTWERNYVKAGKELNVDLTTNPDKVMEPYISAQILIVGMIEGWFTGKKLSDYITLQKSDFKGARRIINGVDKDDEIAEIAKKYDDDLKGVGYGENTPIPTEKPVQEVPKPIAPTVPEEKKTLLDWIIALLKVFLK
jgi:Chitinase class I